MLITQLFLFSLGLAFLLFFADLFVKSAVKLAYLLKISPLIIGATIVGLGTSLPELMVSFFAGLERSGGLVAGNVIGSNIANIGLTLGASLLVGRVRIGTTKTPKLTILHFFLSLFFLSLLTYGVLDRRFGLLFILLTGGVLFWEIQAGRRGAKAEDHLMFLNHPKIEMSRKKGFFLLFSGLLGTFLGGKILVESSLNLAKILRISPTIIGLSLVAFGTSLPELVTDGMATLKGKGKLVIGETLGTNIFNILLVGGVGSILSPLYFTNLVGVCFLLLFAFLLTFLVWFYRGRYVGRWWGGVLVGVYLVYLWFLFK